MRLKKEFGHDFHKRTLINTLLWLLFIMFLLLHFERTKGKLFAIFVVERHKKHLNRVELKNNEQGLTFLKTKIYFLLAFPISNPPQKHRHESHETRFKFQSTEDILWELHQHKNVTTEFYWAVEKLFFLFRNSKSFYAKNDTTN